MRGVKELVPTYQGTTNDKTRGSQELIDFEHWRKCVGELALSDVLLYKPYRLRCARLSRPLSLGQTTIDNITGDVALRSW